MKKIILSSFLFLSFNAFAGVGENHSIDNCKLVNQDNRSSVTITEPATSGGVRTNTTGAAVVE